MLPCQNSGRGLEANTKDLPFDCSFGGWCKRGFAKFLVGESRGKGSSGIAPNEGPIEASRNADGVRTRFKLGNCPWTSIWTVSTHQQSNAASAVGLECAQAGRRLAALRLSLAVQPRAQRHHLTCDQQCRGPGLVANDLGLFGWPPKFQQSGSA